MKKLLLSATVCLALGPAAYGQETESPDEVTINVNRQNFRPYRNNGDNRQWGDYAVNTIYTDLAQVTVFKCAAGGNSLYFPCYCTQGVCTHENEEDNAGINIQISGAHTYTTGVTNTDPSYYISSMTFTAVPTVAGARFSAGTTATEELPMAGKTYSIKYRQPGAGDITYTTDIPDGGRITLENFTVTISKIPETATFPEAGKYYTLALVTYASAGVEGYVITRLDGDKDNNSYGVTWNNTEDAKMAKANRLWTARYNEEHKDGQLWKFVEDPENPGHYAMVCKDMPNGCLNSTISANNNTGRWTYIENPETLDYGFTLEVQSSGNEVKITGANNMYLNGAGPGQGYSVNYYTSIDTGKTWRFKLNTLTADQAPDGVLNTTYDALEGQKTTTLSYTAAANALTATTLYTRFTPTGATPGEFTQAATNKVYSFWRSGLFEYYTAGQGNVSEIKKFDVNVDLKYYTLTIINNAASGRQGTVITLLDGDKDSNSYGANHNSATENHLWTATHVDNDARQMWAFIEDPDNANKYAIVSKAALNGCVNSKATGTAAPARWVYNHDVEALDYGFNIELQSNGHELKVIDQDNIAWNAAGSGQGFSVNGYNDANAGNIWRYKLIAPTHNAETAVPAIEDGTGSLAGIDSATTNITLNAHPQTKLYVKFVSDSNSDIATTAVGDTDENGFEEVALSNNNTYDYKPTTAGTLSWYTKGQGNVSPVASVTYTGTPTSISEISAEAADGAIYDLQGRRLAAPVKGVNIIGGRKVLIK